ncbi:hypothetical protein [Psychrobacter sp. MES7-P7E]|uniref:hypothetical protein n=1 Tax=Psychrobacter sp. MES7-P7E TaxID=2058322 RepID=UPI000C7EB9A7|nr:hypothetical protein [Psychrobacter sp. MES7-P7E]PLT21151.1 hypothetical protein CXF62_11670 [Psychrobacter sp. MES7-P7E]
MHIRINDFAGMFPRLHPTKLPEYAAQSCLNVFIERDILSPSSMADMSNQADGYADFKSAIFFKHNTGTYRHYSNAITRFSFSPVNDAYRLYWTTEDADAPMMFMDWDIVPGINTLTTDGIAYIAGMPPPDTDSIEVTGIIPAPAPSPDPVPDPPVEPTPDDEVTAVLKRKKFYGLFEKRYVVTTNSKPTKNDKDVKDTITDELLNVAEDEEARVYALTYVNKFGDESAPSVHDEILYIKKGDKPVLTLSYTPSQSSLLIASYGVDRVRVYRSLTDSLGRSTMLFVKEVPFALTAGKLVIIDDLPKDSLLVGETIPTINFDPPRDNLKGLGVTDYGVGYAYIDKTVCLSEPYILYAWPRYYEISSQHKIMGMGHYDNTIVIVTTGNPILLNGLSPESMGVISLPLYEGCISTRSMVNLTHGCMYASNNGLVLVTSSSAKLLTDGLFTAEDWQAINPSSIHACSYKGGYLFFWDDGVKKGCGYIDLNAPNKGVVWFDDYAINTFKDEGLVQLIARQVDASVEHSVYREFNPDYGQNRNNKTFVWRSKEFNLDTPKRFLAGQVVADTYTNDAVIFRVYGNGVLIHEAVVKDARPFRVANHSAKRDVSIEIESSVPVREVALGETMRDMIE